MTRLGILAFGFALGVAAERYRQDWQASAYAYYRREDRLSMPPGRQATSQDQRRP